MLLGICTVCEMYCFDWCNKGLNDQCLGRIPGRENEKVRGMDLGTREMPMGSRAGQTWGMEER